MTLGCSVSNILRTVYSARHLLQVPTQDYVNAAAQAAIEIHRAEVPGDILIFLTGRSEVHACIDSLKQAAQGTAFRHAQGRFKPVALFAGASLLSALHSCWLVASTRNFTKLRVLATTQHE